MPSVWAAAMSHCICVQWLSHSTSLEAESWQGRGKTGNLGEKHHKIPFLKSHQRVVQEL